MDSPDAVPDGPRAQHDVLRAIVERIASHPGVMKIYLAGSLASGEADAYSDVALVVHVDPVWTTQVWTDREQLVAISVERVLDLSHQWGGLDLSYAVLYRNGVYLDLTFVAEESATHHHGVEIWSRRTPPAAPAPSSAGGQRRPGSDPDPLDDALRMFWLGSVLCAKYLARGHLWTGLWFIESRRNLFLRAWRLAHDLDKVDWGWAKVHEHVPAPILNRLADTVTPLHRTDLTRALTALMDLMDEQGPALAEACGTPYPKAAAAAIRDEVLRILALQ